MALNLDLRSIPQPDEKARPAIVLTQSVLLKACVSMMLGAIGLYYIATGRRDREVSRMVLGALLFIASLLVF